MNCRTLYCHHEGKLLDHAAKNVFKSLKAVVSSLCHPHVTLECLHSCASYKYLGNWGFWCFLFCCAWSWTQPELCWASAEPLSYILSSFVYSFVCYFLVIVWVVQTSLEHSVAQGIFKFLILLPRPPKITACAIGPGILLLFYFVKGFLNCMGILPEYMTVHHMYSSYLWWPEEVMGSSDLKL